MSATFCAALARARRRGCVDVSVLPVPPFGPRTQTSREFSFCERRLRALLAGHRACWISKRICSGVAGSMTMSSAPASNARRRKPLGDPWPEHHDVEVRVLAGHPVQEQQGAVRVAGAGDEQQIGDAAAQPAHRLFGAGDDADDVEVLAAGQRVLYVLGVDTGLDSEKCLYRAARHWLALPTSYLRSVDAFAVDGLVGFAPTTGRSTNQNCALSSA